MRRIALEDEYFIQRKFHPNVDFYSGIIYPAIGFKPEMFTVLFAIPAWRVGWRSDRRHSSPNCGALPRDLVESELFGCRRGAFTGAYADAPGLFVSGHRGMVFLDEVGEMPKDTQVKMLQVQQEKELRPVGSTKCVPVDVRIIAATNRLVADLRSECLREDLCFRIATVVIEIPPLRARPDDTQVLRSQP